MKRILEHGPNRVLVINNNTSNTISELRQKLAHSGYEVILASGSYEGIKVFRLNPDRYRMIIIDIGIQDIPGIDLARLFLDLNLNPNTSVIIHARSGDMIIKLSKKGIRIKKIPQKLFRS